MSMQENSKKIKSFKGLEDYAHLFKPSDGETEKVTINSNLVVNDSNKLFKPKEHLKEKAKRSKPPEVQLTFHKNLRSFRNKEHKFCNFLDSKGCTKEKEALQKIFENEGEVCTRDLLPFTLEEETLRLEERPKTILDAAGLLNNEKSGDIGKGTYLDQISKLNSTTAKKGQPIRIYFKDEDGKVEIILIDLYHMFASNKMKEITKKYRILSRYNYCMNNIRGKC